MMNAGRKNRKERRPLPAALARDLEAVRMGLLRVHKTLLDHERVRYEQRFGEVQGNARFLQLAIRDPFFQWLHAMSQLIVAIDELAWADEPAPSDAEAMIRQARQMLRPDERGEEFQREYHRAIQESPAVAAAHAQWTKDPPAEPTE